QSGQSIDEVQRQNIDQLMCVCSKFQKAWASHAHESDNVQMCLNYFRIGQGCGIFSAVLRYPLGESHKETRGGAKMCTSGLPVVPWKRNLLAR
ncbi:unnamed protein product, partial [Mycena citricolor]